MGRGVLSVLLAAILWVHCGLSAKAEVVGAGATSQASTSHKPTLKEQVIQIPAGSQVEVRLLNQERFRGRLGDVSDEGFTVQIAKGNQIETRKLAFGDVKSMKQIGGKTHTAIYILAGVGIAFGIILVLAFTLGRAGNPGIRI